MSDGWSLALLSVLAGDIILWPRICRSSRAHRHQGCVCAHGDVIVRCCAAHIPAIPLPPSHSSSLGSPSGPVPCGRERASPPALLRETVAAAAAARLSRSRRAPPYADKLLRAAPYGTREKAARPATAAVRSSSSGRGRQCHWGTSGQKLSTPFGLLITSSDTTWHVAAAHMTWACIAAVAACAVLRLQLALACRCYDRDAAALLRWRPRPRSSSRSASAPEVAAAAR
jgi:acyl-CoA synthetase (AMP-forming)/AMP-acid ligase II